MNRRVEQWIVLADIIIPLSFRFPETRKLFARYEYIENNNKFEYTDVNEEPLYVDTELWNRMLHVVAEETPGPWSEFYQFTGLISRYLLKKNACVFHGVAFMYLNKVWLICAPSGTGKTTQWNNWNNIFNEEISLISGDKPIVKLDNEGAVMVYSSPWNGKEGYIGEGFGPLGGIIYLEQADKNEIMKMEVKDVVTALFHEFLFYADTKEEIYEVAQLEDAILRRVPVWKLRNSGDTKSAILTQKTLLNYINNHGSNDSL